MQEAAARAAGAGVWRGGDGGVERPWEYRRRLRQEAAQVRAICHSFQLIKCSSRKLEGDGGVERPWEHRRRLRQEAAQVPVRAAFSR